MITPKEIRARIDARGNFNCSIIAKLNLPNMDCIHDETICPFASNYGCGGAPSHFDFNAMKHGRERKLSSLTKYRKEHEWNFPNLK